MLQIGSQKKLPPIDAPWVTESGNSIVRKHYVNVDNPFDDAYVATKLTEGGAIAYELHPDAVASVSDEWLFTHVVPHIRDRYENDKRLCKVLALALLWGAFDNDAREGMKIGTVVRDKFVVDFSHIRGVSPTNYNPVRKLFLDIHHSNGQLRVMKIPPPPPIGETTTITTEGATAASVPIPPQNNNTIRTSIGSQQMVPQQSINNLYCLMFEFQRQVTAKLDQISANITETRTYLPDEFKTVNNNIRRNGGSIHTGFAHQLQRTGAGPSQEGRAASPDLYGAYGFNDPRAALSKKPRSLYQLWTEWQQGIDGNKPAKDFTKAERNSKNNKQKFYRRLNVWALQAKLLRQGHSILSANDHIHTVTGGKTVTAVIDKIISYKREYKDQGGCHPSLQ